MSEMLNRIARIETARHEKVERLDDIKRLERVVKDESKVFQLIATAVAAQQSLIKALEQQIDEFEAQHSIKH